MRSALLCLAGSIVLVLLSAPLIHTFVLQVRLMTLMVWPDESAAIEAYQRELGKPDEITPVWRAFARFGSPLRGPDDARVLEELDPANGLRPWLELLLILRRDDPAAVSRPADADRAVLTALDSLRAAPPVRLHAPAERQKILKALADEPLRERAAYANLFLYLWPTDRQPNASRSGRPILAELASRLEALADRWQNEGRDAAARDARQAVAKLMTEVVTDSPTPEMAMLASEHLIPTLRALGQAPRAERLEEFRNRWQKASSGDRINLIPRTAEAVLAETAHDRVMRSMTATLATFATWLVFAGAAFFLMVVVLVTQPPDQITVQWRRPKRGPREAAVLACSPLLAMLIIIAVADIPWTWLISWPSAIPALLLTSLLLVSSGAATWICVQLPELFRPCPLPARAAWVAAVLVVPTVLLLMLFVPVGRESWQPPAAIQRFRLWGTVIGSVSLGLVVLWLVAGVIHRTRTGLPAGVWARAGLGTVTAAMMLTSILFWPVMAVNQYCDIRHERAFAAAAAEPIADRLGTDWLNRYFPSPATSEPAAARPEE